MNLKYRDNDYFNTSDYYLIVGVLKEYHISKLHKNKGIWYSDIGFNYKMTSIRCQNCREILNETIELLNGFIGRVNKITEDGLGIHYSHQPELVRREGIPPYWINNLKQIKELTYYEEN